MWDRFRQKDGGAPSLNRKKLEAWQNSHSSSPASSGRGVKGGNSQYQYAVKGGPAPIRPPKAFEYPPEDTQQNYLTAPPAHAPPVAGRIPQHDSAYGRPVSSIYSQPSPEAAVFAARQLRDDVARSDPLEISPPSSPDIASPRDGPNPGDVSPIDETPDMSQLAQERTAPPPRAEPRTSIPMMRRERRKNSDAAMNSLRESKSRDRPKQPRPYGNDVRWDPRTGEPTTSAKGRPSQVNPQEYVHGLTSRVVATSSSQDRPSQPDTASFRDRLRPVRQTSASPQPELAPRPEWRGASGRTTLVAPVKDNKHVAPLKIPPKSSKRAGRSFAILSPVESNGSEAASSPLETVTRDLSPDNGIIDVRPSGANTMQPLVPPSQELQSPIAASPAQSRPLASAYPTPPVSEDPTRASRPLLQERPGAKATRPPPLLIPSNEKAIRRKPARISDHHPEASITSPEWSHHDIPPPHASLSVLPSEWTQPASRFSITTYATSNHTSTPRMSVDEDVPPLPTPPQLSTPSPTPQLTPGISILDRGRPIVAGYENSPRVTPTEPVRIVLDSPLYATSPTTITATKPRPAGPRGQAVVVPQGNHSTLSVASVSDVDKSLPPAPPEASAKDRVAELNAQLEALGNRRININTAIRQMTEMMPTDNILASQAVVRKREEEKRKVEALRTELADVERQSYELGLKLHRAYKRLDRDAEYEPTTLWVRRVTG
ncbi:hypothetical protein F5Y19DRAFT_482400 [Xylariaceae sp. FL1651]|nr:hypothetical protein F5Y19DRAFT_482400 [Xylariaceae sp. FL1651]